MRRRWWDSSLTFKFVLPVAASTLAILGLVAAVLGFIQKAAAEAEVREEARLIATQLSTVQAYITDHYVNPVLRAGAGVALPPPPVAIIEISRQLSRQGQFEARLINARPRNPRNAPRDDFERTGLDRLARGEAAYERFERIGGKLYYRRLTPYVALVEGCSTCHPGTRRGDVLGNLSLSIPYDRKARAVAANMLALGGGAVVLATCLVLLIWAAMRRTVITPLRALAETAGRVAAGQLDGVAVRVRSGDEIGRVAASFNEMVANLRELLARIRSAGEGVAAATENVASAVERVTDCTREITTAIRRVAEGAAGQRAGAEEACAITEQLRQATDQIAEGAQAQAGAVDHTQAAMHQMAQVVDQVAQLAQEVAVRAGEALAVAERGGAAVAETVAGMARIRTTALEAAGRVEELGRNSQQIGEIVQVIGNIADQTDLLALNAAIEAARAGEHGRGFAVVADEVRKLAEKAARATREITVLVETIRRGVEGAVAAMDAATREVAAGTELASAVGSGLQDILQAMRDTKLQVQNISAAAEEMAAGVNEVVRSVDRVARITEQHAAATQEMAASTVQVATSVRQLSSVSHETAAAVEQVDASTRGVSTSNDAVRAAAVELAATARELHSLVGRFRL